MPNCISLCISRENVNFKDRTNGHKGLSFFQKYILIYYVSSQN